MWNHKQPLLGMTLLGLLTLSCGQRATAERELPESLLKSWVLEVPPKAIDDSWSGLPVLESKTLRFSPFKNGRIHYQVDGLGSGSGYWEIREGAMHVFAQRPRFDMHWIVSGAHGGTDQDWIVQFRDRFGVQREKIVLIRDQANRSLRPFTSSEFNL